MTAELAMEPEDIKDLDGVKVWIIRHQARCEPWKKQAEERHDNVMKALNEQGDRIGSVEKRLARYAGAAIVIGVVASTVLKWILENAKGN